MRKIILQFFIFAILLSLVACGESSETVSSTKLFEYDQNTPSEPDFSQEILIESEEPEEVVGVATEYLWVEAYLDALSNSDSFPANSILLVDIDFDGVPEILFVAHGAATNMNIIGGLSYQNGEVVDIEFYEGWGGIPTELSLLRNIQTGEKVWLAHGRYSSNAGREQYWVYDFVDFSDFSQVQYRQVLAYGSVFVLDEEDTFTGPINFLHLNGEEIEVPFEEIEARREEILRGFEVIDVKILSIHSSQVYYNGDTWQDRTLNRDKMISFFNEWVVGTYPSIHY